MPDAFEEFMIKFLAEHPAKCCTEEKWVHDVCLCEHHNKPATQAAPVAGSQPASAEPPVAEAAA